MPAPVSPWRREPGRHRRVGDVRLPGVRGLPRCERVVEHHPRAPERPGQRLTLGTVRVKAVVVAKLHVITVLVYGQDIDIRTGRHSVFALMPTWFLSRSTGTRSSPGTTSSNLKRSCGTCAPTSRRNWPSSTASQAAPRLLVSHSAEGRTVQAGQLAEGRLVAADAARVPGPAPPLLESNRLSSGSYFAGSVGGAPVSVLRQYIEQQDRPVWARRASGPPASAFTTGLNGRRTSGRLSWSVLRSAGARVRG